MSYNLTGLAENSTGILPFVQGVNGVLMGGWLGNIFLIGLFCILFLSFYQATNEVKKAAPPAFFIIFLLGILFRALNLTHQWAFTIPLLGFAVSLAFMWKETT